MLRGKSIAIVLKPFCFVVLDISLIRIDFYGFLFAQSYFHVQFDREEILSNFLMNEIWDEMLNLINIPQIWRGWTVHSWMKFWMSTRWSSRNCLRSWSENSRSEMNSSMTKSSRTSSSLCCWPYRSVAAMETWTRRRKKPKVLIITWTAQKAKAL